MLKLESLDKKFSPLENGLGKLLVWLIEKLSNKEIEVKKQLNSEADFYLEVYLVNRKTLNKNVYAYEFPKEFPVPEGKSTPLGEIYLNPDVIEKQEYSLNYMAIHGFLHLIGYDHKSKNDTIAMESLEQKLLGEFESTT